MPTESQIDFAPASSPGGEVEGVVKTQFQPLAKELRMLKIKLLALKIRNGDINLLLFNLVCV